MSSDRNCWLNVNWMYKHEKKDGTKGSVLDTVCKSDDVAMISLLTANTLPFALKKDALSAVFCAAREHREL